MSLRLEFNNIYIGQNYRSNSYLKASTAIYILHRNELYYGTKGKVSSSKLSHKRPDNNSHLSIVAIGGANPYVMHPDVPCRQLQTYKPTDDTWTTLTTLPQGLHHHGAVVIGNSIYVVGDICSFYLNIPFYRKQ